MHVGFRCAKFMSVQYYADNLSFHYESTCYIMALGKCVGKGKEEVLILKPDCSFVAKVASHAVLLANSLLFPNGQIQPWLLGMVIYLAASSSYHKVCGG